MRRNPRALAFAGVLVLTLGFFAHLRSSQASDSLSGPDFVAALNRYLDLQYEAEFYVREFDRALDQLVLEKDKFPQRELDPLSTEPYLKLKALWPEISLETDRLAEAYENLSRSRSEALKDVQTWLGNLSEADRLQIVPLLLKWREIDRVQTRLPSWLGQSNLEALVKEHEAEIKAKAKAAAAKANRKPLPPGDTQEEADRGNVAYPSPGSAGNFTGNLLPQNIFVLTFDDGPGPKSTLRLHKVLKEYRDPVNTFGAPATFFVLIEKVHKAPDVFQATRELGFHINNHSWTHANFAKLSKEKLRYEIVDSSFELRNLLGASFRFFRCPYGACIAPKVPAARELIAEQGLIHAFWNIDSVDWKNIGQPQRTASIVTKEMQVKKRGLILLHDIHESTVDATALILNWIRSRNEAGARFELMDLEDAVDLVNRAKL